MLRRLLAALLIALVAIVAWQWLTWPDVAALRDENPETTAFMEQRKRQLRRAGKDDSIDYRWVSYDRISRNLRRAVIVSEDNAFYEHEGFDRKELEESIRRNIRERQFARGGSTITQQLAKNLWLSASKNPLRKVKELLLARQLERDLSKKRILELYLNVVEYGERVYGAEAAARHYFGKSASSLTPSEAALLAGSLPNPRRMNPADPNRRLRARQDIILSRMRRWGHIADESVSEPAPAETRDEAAPTPTDQEPLVVPTEDEVPPATDEVDERTDDPVPDSPDEPVPPSGTAEPPLSQDDGQPDAPTR